MGTRKEKKRRNKKHERRVRTKLKEKNGNMKKNGTNMRSAQGES